MCGKSAFQVDIEKYCQVLLKTTRPHAVRKIKLLMMNMGLHCIAVYRFGQFARRLEQRHRAIGRAVRIVYLLVNHALLMVHKVELNEEGEIGAGFHISHVGTIYIGPCKIGENCTVTHNVTIGLGFDATRSGVPTIGNNVWIGTGSVVVGDITIGDGVTISAGSILTRSVPAKCLVAGNPARLIAKDYDNSRMIGFRMDDESEVEIESDKEETEVMV